MNELQPNQMRGFDSWFPTRPFRVYANNADRKVKVLRIGQKRLRVEYTTKAGGTWRPWRQATDVRLTVDDLNSLTNSRTAFRSFAELVGAKGYRPTIFPRDFWDHVLIAHYNRLMKQRGDKRRVYSGF